MGERAERASSYESFHGRSDYRSDVPGRPVPGTHSLSESGA